LSFKWKEDNHRAFEDLKEKLSFTPTLKFPNFTLLFEVHINANDFTIIKVFKQDEHPIAFESKKLYGAQLRWLTHEKELYIIMCYVKTWQHYLGTHKTKVFTNNVFFKYFETQPKASMK
jgi:hypothetical protein